MDYTALCALLKCSTAKMQSIAELFTSAVEKDVLKELITALKTPESRAHLYEQTLTDAHPRFAPYRDFSDSLLLLIVTNLRMTRSQLQLFSQSVYRASLNRDKLQNAFLVGLAWSQLSNAEILQKIEEGRTVTRLHEIKGLPDFVDERCEPALKAAIVAALARNRALLAREKRAPMSLKDCVDAAFAIIELHSDVSLKVLRLRHPVVEKAYFRARELKQKGDFELWNRFQAHTQKSKYAVPLTQLPFRELAQYLSAKSSVNRGSILKLLQQRGKNHALYADIFVQNPWPTAATSWVGFGVDCQKLHEFWQGFIEVAGIEYESEFRKILHPELLKQLEVRSAGRWYRELLEMTELRVPLPISLAQIS